MNLQTEEMQSEPPKTETAWSRIKKALGPVGVVGVLFAKLFAKLKFILLRLLKFLTILLKSGGTTLLMMWLYMNFWGASFSAPLVIAHAWFGYLLNLFNLTPVGLLDGVRIVTALSRWLWLPGFALLLWFGGKFPNFIVWHIVLQSLPRIYSLFRKRTEEEQRYFEVTPSQRWTMSILYFGLIAVLIFGMHLAQIDLNKHGVRSHGHGQDVIVQ